MWQQDLKYWLGLVAFIAIGVGAAAKQFPVAWEPWLTLTGVVGTAVMGYLITPHTAIPKDQ